MSMNDMAWGACIGILLGVECFVCTAVIGAMCIPKETDYTVGTDYDGTEGETLLRDEYSREEAENRDPGYDNNDFEIV